MGSKFDTGDGRRGGLGGALYTGLMLSFLFQQILSAQCPGTRVKYHVKGSNIYSEMKKKMCFGRKNQKGFVRCKFALTGCSSTSSKIGK